MENLQQATEKICQLKGEAMAMQSMLAAIIRVLPETVREAVLREFDQEAEIGRVTLLNSDRAGEHVLHGFETFVQQVKTIRR